MCEAEALLKIIHLVVKPLHLMTRLIHAEPWVFIGGVEVVDLQLLVDALHATIFLVMVSGAKLIDATIQVVWKGVIAILTAQ